MARLVQKFGGTSVRDAQHIGRVAKIVHDAARSGREIVVVVSAMGHTTDQLIDLAEQVNDVPDARELDMLLSTGEQVSISLVAMALQKLGLKARSFTGAQAGILTDDTHTYARIKTVQPSRVESSLRRGEIAVVAGFQGMTRTSDISTLGRGGSDTTAVALAAALKAECCDIYTDVNGVYTTDPRCYGQARRLHTISYEEMLELASMGAQVLNARSVELALRQNVPVRLRSTFEPDDTGTLVTSRELAPDYQICGVALDTNRVSFRLSLPRDFSVAEPGVQDERENHYNQRARRVVEELCSLGLTGEQINLRKDGPTVCEIEFNCEKRLSRSAKEVLLEFFPNDNGAVLRVDSDVARISVVGAGARVFHQRGDIVNTLRQASIPVAMVTTGTISVSAVVPAKYKDDAVKQLHEAFCNSHNFAEQAT